MTEIIVAVGSIIATILGKNFWDSRKESSANKTKIELKKLQLDSNADNILIEQNKELLQKINHLEIILERTSTSFEMLVILLKEEFSEKPHVISAFEMISKNLKQK